MADALLLRNYGEDRDDGLQEHAAGIEILRGEAAIADAVLREILQASKCFGHSLPTETVEAPEQHQLKLPAGSGFEQCLELLAVAVPGPCGRASSDLP